MTVINILKALHVAIDEGKKYDLPTDPYEQLRESQASTLDSLLDTIDTYEYLAEEPTSQRQRSSLKMKRRNSATSTLPWESLLLPIRMGNRSRMRYRLRNSRG